MARPRPGASLARRIEEVEHPLVELRRNPGAVVLDGQHHAVALAIRGEPHARTPPRLLGGGDPVLHQVEQELAHLVAVDRDLGAAGAIVDRDLDRAQPQLTGERLAQLVEQIAGLRLRQRERPRPRVRQEVGDQVLEPRDLGAGDREQAVVRAPIVRNRLLLEHLHVEVEAVERAADLVREAGGEGADVGELLRFLGAPFELLGAAHQEQDEQIGPDQHHHRHRRDRRRRPDEVGAQLTGAALELDAADADDERADVAHRHLDHFVGDLAVQHLGLDQRRIGEIELPDRSPSAPGPPAIPRLDASASDSLRSRMFSNTSLPSRSKMRTVSTIWRLASTRSM